jgi:1-acyl-sn-glycerol-3-phosphate acyltransferase
MTLITLPHRARQSTQTDFREALHAAREGAGQLARRFWYSMRRCWWHSYWQLEVTGVENIPARGAFLLCANHTSHLDAIAILAALPKATALRTTTAAARDAFNRPVRNSISRVLTNAMLLQRGSAFSGGLRELENVLREKRPVILFPEGRRSLDGRISNFKSGAAMLAIRTGTPIIPIRLEGARDSLARGKYLPLPSRVAVWFGKPIDPRTLRAAIDDGRIDRRTAYQQLTDSVKSSIVGMED